MIKAPNWCKDAEPTLRGWVSPKGELLKSQKLTEEQIAEWYGSQVEEPKQKKASKKKDVVEVEEDQVVEVVEDPDLDSEEEE